jgi:hypothetical protein
VVAARASHLLHMQERSGVAAPGTYHLVVRGRRSGAARGRSKPPVVVSGLPLHDLILKKQQHAQYNQSIKV